MKRPEMTVRFTNKGELEVIRKAAKLDARSINQFVVRAAVTYAKSLLQSGGDGIHRPEMILPTPLAKVVREMANAKAKER